MGSRLGSVAFCVVLGLTACFAAVDITAATNAGLPFRVPVYRPSPPPGGSHPMAAQFCPPATTDPSTMAPHYTHYYSPRPYGKQPDPAPSFTPVTAIYSLLTIPFKLVSVAASHVSRLGASAAPSAGYAPMAPPEIAPVSPSMARHHHVRGPAQPLYSYPPMR